MECIDASVLKSSTTFIKCNTEHDRTVSVTITQSMINIMRLHLCLEALQSLKNFKKTVEVVGSRSNSRISCVENHPKIVL